MDNQNKEIDLVEVLSVLISKVRNNKILFISIIFVFIILGFVYNSTKKETYSNTFVATSSINNVLLSQFIDNINNSNLSEKKLIPNLEKINIDYQEITESNDMQLFYIEVIVDDTLGVEETIKALKQLLEENEYISDYLQNKKDIIVNKIENYKKEIAKINDIQSMVFKQEGNNSTVISTNGLSNEKILLLDKILYLQNEYKELTSLHVIKDKYNRTKSTKNRIAIFILFLFLGVSFALIAILLKK